MRTRARSMSFTAPALLGGPLLVTALGATGCGDGHGGEFSTRGNAGQTPSGTTTGTATGTTTTTTDDTGDGKPTFPPGTCVNGSNMVVTKSPYTIVDPGEGSCSQAGYDGSGLVRDDETGLSWDRYPTFSADGFTQAAADAYCAGRGARLPTHDEVEGVVGVRYDSCAWPCGWITWTSTKTEWGGYYVAFGGSQSSTAPGDLVESYSICVRP